MLACRFLQLWNGWLLGVACWWLLGTTCLQAAKAENVLADQLAAGEFGPALAAAEKLPAGLARDQALGQIAAAQAGAGARQAAAATLFAMNSDAERADVLARVAAAPLAGFPGQGGGAQADFDTLIELIKSTVAPDTWDDVGGKGAVEEFPGGVYVNALGELKERGLPAAAAQGLAEIHRRAAPSAGRTQRNAQAESHLRMVSLTRLERELQIRQAMGEPASDEMLRLAGLYKVKYVFCFPETGDVVLAGAAGPWQRNAEGRALHTASGRPVLNLDDLVVLLRNALGDEGKFGCSITPTQRNLARTREFLEASAATPLKPGQRAAWVDELRKQVGPQEISVYGIDPRTRVAQVIVEADYHMKRIGMGLAAGTLGVKSYLDSVSLGPEGAPPPMNVLRWWFTLNHEAALATSDYRAFEIRGQAAQVLSENELLTRQGERVHTGQADDLNREFTLGFTRNMAALAAKYPVYAELENVFDLALAAALLAAEKEAGRLEWPLHHFLNSERCPVALGVAPVTVESIVNSRALNARHFVAGVSGGVAVNARKFVRGGGVKIDTYGELKAARERGAPAGAFAIGQWWWD